MKRKAIWAVLTVLLASLGACERGVPPVGPTSGPIPLTAIPTYAIPVTCSTTPNLSPTIPVTFAPSVTATIPVSYTMTVPPTSTPTLTATIPMTVTSTTTPSANFTLVKSESDNLLVSGQAITYTLSYTQTGSPASNVELIDMVPSEVTFVYAAEGPGIVFSKNGNLLTWTFSGPVTNLSGSVNWVGLVSCVPSNAITNVAGITASGATTLLSNEVVCFVTCATSTPTVPVTFTATAIPSTPTNSPTIPVTFVPSVTATIPVTFTETVPPSTPTLTATIPITVTTTTTPTAKFALVKSESAQTIAPGQPITYTLSYTQSGGPVSNLVLSDTLPAGVNFYYSNATSAGDPGVVFNQNGNLLTWAFPNTVDNLNGDIFWVGTVGNIPCNAITNIAALTAPGMSPVLSNGVVCFVSCVSPTPTIPVTFTSTPSFTPTLGGGPITLTSTPDITPTVPVTFTVTTVPSSPSTTPTIPAIFTSTPIFTATIPVTFTPSSTSTPVLAPPTPACSGATIIGYNYNESPVTLAGGTVYYAQYPCGMTATLSTIHTSFVSSGISATVGIYADNSGVPGELLSSTGSFASIDGWNSVPLTTSINVTKGNNYWLAIQISSACVFNGGYLGDSYFSESGASLPVSLNVPASPVTGRLGLYGDLCP